jgi:pSer/pThr/pTyr-binding forkhead associated (FHA) protein
VSSSPLLFRIYKNGQIHVVKQFVNEQRIVIGHGSGVNIDLQAPEVSSIHCAIEKRDDGYYICDLGSEQGTYLEGQSVVDQPIASGDHFQVGPFDIYFLLGNQKNIELDEKDRSSSDKDRGVAQQPVPPPQQPKPAAPPAEKQGKAAPAAEARAQQQAKPSKQGSATSVMAAAPAAAASSKRILGPANSLKDIIRPVAGSRAEVIVSWQERIIETYHFGLSGQRSIGAQGDIVVPAGTVPENWKLLTFKGNDIEIALPNGVTAEVNRNGELSPVRENRFTIKSGEAAFLTLANNLQLAIRFAPKAPIMLLDSPFVLGVTEFAGVLAALILAVLTSLIVSVNKPKTEEAEAQVERLAKVVFAPRVTPPPIIQEDTQTQPPQPEKPVEVKKVDLAEKKTEAKTETPKPEEKKPQQANSGKASDVKPKDPKLTKKMFTATKSGGAIKTTDQNAANMKSKEPDVQNTGLLAAFGSGGARNKLDKAYSGSGELLGAGEKATGTSGFNSNRSGDDLGSRAKDTGAGGAGTATQGIAGVGTQGRGTGMTGSGAGMGFGDKGKVQIEAGGNEENFTGTIDKEAVRRVVKSALAQFKACYEKEYRMNSKLEGKVVVQWEIHEQGVAKNAQIVRVKSTINNSAVEECVKNRMMALKFPEPPPGTAAEVTYPFIFQGQKL